MYRTICCLLTGLLTMGTLGQQQTTGMRLLTGAPSYAQEDLFAIGLSRNVTDTCAEQLNVLLATEYMLYVKTQKYHWNVVGPFFGSLHALFNTQYDQLADIIDAVAERVHALNVHAIGTLTEMSSLSAINEEPGVNPVYTTMLSNLLYDHQIVIRMLRDLATLSAELDDMATNNFVCDLLEKHEKMAWMLRAHLQ